MGPAVATVDVELEGYSGRRPPSIFRRPLARWEKMGFFRKLRTLPDEESFVSLQKEPSISSKEARPLSPGRNSPRGLATSAAGIDDQDVCNINDSPKRLIKLAAAGQVEVLEKLLSQRHERLLVTDASGKTLLHHAAENGHVLMVDMLFQRGSDLEATDNDGQTPLHLAAMKDHVKVVQALLNLNAKKCAQTKLMETPLHIAVRHNALESIECILNACSCAKDLVNMGGWHGKTPLHVAAMLNSVECVKLLMAYGADPIYGCQIGLNAGHVAAARSADAVMWHLLNDAGLDKELLLHAQDEEKRTMLHYAVIRGCPSSVRLLIDNGAPMDAQMNDGSTPLHLACTQGLIPAVEEMLHASKSGFALTLSKRDAQGMSPLHRATMFDHEWLAKFLLDHDAPMNATDSLGRTPLILSAAQGSWAVLNLLLKSNVDTTVTDNMGRNFLHYYISQGKSPEACECARKAIREHPSLLSDMDLKGCTPLHYAAQNGFIRSSDSLMLMGAQVNAKNKVMQSPLHFAAAHGRYNTVRRLLESLKGFNILNEGDNYGRTPLHLAAQNGHSNVVQLLMSKGALTHRDYGGQTALHYAAENNFRETARLFVEQYSYLLNSIDRQGNTALHLAARNNASKTVEYLLTAGSLLLLNSDNQCPIDLAIQQKHPEAATTMVMHKRWKEILTQPSTAYGWPVLGLIEHLPDVMATALDRCISHTGCHHMSKEFMVTYDFTLLEPDGVDYVDSAAVAAESEQTLKALNAMVKHGRSDLLDHGVCCSYLNNKWASYGLFVHGSNVALYATFLALLTFLVLSGVQMHLLPNLKRTSYENVHSHAVSNDTFDSEDPRIDKWLGKEVEKSQLQLAVVILVCIFTHFNMIKELVQLYHQRWNYFSDCTNYIEWFLYITATLFALGGCSHLGVDLDWQTRWQLGAGAIFIAWFNFMLYLQRFGLMGVYVVMYLGVLKTLLRAVFVFAFLLIAFSLAFHVLIPLMVYPDNSDFYMKPNLLIDIAMLRTPHQTFGHSLLRTVSMMLGDFDMITNYINPMVDETLPFPGATYTFIMVFIGTVSILLMNLLIGLAVGDIEKVQSGAKLRRLAMQVDLHSRLESKLPKWYLKRIATKEEKYYPNRCRYFFTKKLWFITRDPYDAAEKQLLTQGHIHTSSLSNRVEMMRHRKKIKEAHVKLDKQYELLRLIVQKMDINEEADQLDEGLRAKGPEALYLGAEHRDKNNWRTGEIKMKAIQALTSGSRGHH
ncbi:Transient receptor potential cation channel subfamily A member 1 [Hypsibius exemplaris]|uniref:Transient receptor potential cation channel subfamily A member 1 n=1 Tax=Hypsibius exemplaris TaxID=2072580 RepID=A0A1W0WBB8_HYPEX|nr:Transient receptor potential cation channel subfamily A member 1 [Hypsibius exemplaris]